MTKTEVRSLQKRLNAFFDNAKLRHTPIKVDGEVGPSTRARVQLAKYYLGYKGNTTSAINNQFLWRLRNPSKTTAFYQVSKADVKRGAQRRAARRKALRTPKWSWLWGGSRGVVNEVISVVNGRVPITSRKRWATFGNPGSDHHMSQRSADAVDFATANNYALAREIARKLGGSWSGDYDSFYITRKGRRYRVQIIAGTHGTGPHLHVGVRRA